MPTTSPVATRVRRVAVGCLALVTFAACSSDAPNVSAPPTSADLVAIGRTDDLGPALAAQARHHGRLVADRDLLGTGIGRLSDGRPEVTVYARNASAAARVPRALDGVPVVVEVTGDITILPQASPRKGRPGGGGGGIRPTDYARPASIGMSTGNAKECASGTIGAKVSKGGTMYALSNNHVFARENAGATGELIYQPGRYDLNCGSNDGMYGFATLATYQKIDFSGTNTADVALARLNDASQLNATTLPGGYGTVGATNTTATPGLAVQKYGRTTGLTTGTVTGTNVHIRVQYTDGIADFDDQIEIKGNKGAFSRAGDSGSLIVTLSGNNPVGLLFAGGQNVTFAATIANALAAVGNPTIVR